MADCNKCSGRGYVESSRTLQCKTCKGKGEILKGVNGFYYQTQCDYCDGIGKLHTESCKKCKGSGIKGESAVHTIQIPSGVTEEVVLSLRGAGNTLGNRHGNLNISFQVRTILRYTDPVRYSLVKSLKEEALTYTVRKQYH